MLTLEQKDKLMKSVLDKSQDMSAFILHLVIEKKQGVAISWQDIANAVYKYYGVKHHRSWYSRNWDDSVQVLDLSTAEEIEPETEDCDEPSMIDSLKEELLELKKERVKVQDERAQNRAYIRKIARDETLKEIALEAAREMNSKKILSTSQEFVDFGDSEKDAILLLSDWHYGMEVNSHWNTYNPEIAIHRITKLLEEVIYRCQEENIGTIHVLNLGDLIAGRIHLPIRIQSRVDTITQIMNVSEILAEFLTELDKKFARVHYYSCTDNHSRVESDKESSIDLESLCRITDWYLDKRLEDTGVAVHTNTYSEDIITFKSQGHNIIAVHGDKDKPSEAISKLSNFTRDVYDAVLMSHRHHFSADEECGTLVIGNGALMGTDGYAKSLRLHSSPSQTLIFTTRERVADSIVRIVL